MVLLAPLRVRARLMGPTRFGDICRNAASGSARTLAKGSGMDRDIVWYFVVASSADGARTGFLVLYQPMRSSGAPGPGGERNREHGHNNHVLASVRGHIVCVWPGAGVSDWWVAPLVLTMI